MLQFLYIASTSVVVKIGILEPKEMTLCFGRLVPRVNPQLALLYTKVINRYCESLKEKLRLSVTHYL